jgi:hypothetical protein
VNSIRRHLHSVKCELDVIKHSVLPHAAFHAIQMIGRLPVLFPFPFGLFPTLDWNPLRTYVAIPLIRLALTSCESSSPLPPRPWSFA